ncbi:MAG: RNA polymerase sigma factor [Deltaproteobacteria bacterium]|jgi:RNA polymerase sigma-70 factor (ECF subfamily)|nr:RNA polymerase sigma factor [Deltaproteobacteria bacterium]MBW2483500.1 RNA polymerase sigma factor [Deltaproteobacteria bacterium]
MTVKKNQNRKIVKDNDFDLIQAINSGQTEKFHDLVKRYEHKLYNFSLRMCRDRSDAEDMIQDTFLNVFKYLKNFRYESKFKNWLYKVAASTCIKKRRKSKFAPEKELSLDEFLPDEEAEKPDHIPEWALLPLDKLLNDELRDKINETILTLPKKYRLVMVLRDIEEFSTDETAEILNLSPSNVKVRLHRARLYMRDKLKGYFENDQ